MLKLFPGNVWLDPDDIVMMRPVVSWRGEVEGKHRGGYTAEVEVSMRGGGHHHFTVGAFWEDSNEAHQSAYNEAANWLKDYVHRHNEFFKVQG